MTGRHDGLAQALRISQEMLALAESGGLEALEGCNARRLGLLQSAASGGAAARSADETACLREIAAINDRSIGLLEHRLRIKAREMDIATVGRRAVAAYSTTQRR